MRHSTRCTNTKKPKHKLQEMPINSSTLKNAGIARRRYKDSAPEREGSIGYGYVGVVVLLDVDDSVHRGAALWAAFPGDDPDSIAALETGWATTTRYRHGGDAFSIAQVGVGNGGLVGRCVMAHDMKYRRVGDGVQGAIAASDNQRRAKTESWQ